MRDRSDIGPLPTDWQHAPLSTLVVALKNGTTAEQNSDGRGVPVTRIETIATGRIDPARVRYVDASAQEMAPFRLEAGDLLLSHINSVAHIGKLARYSGGPPLYHGMNLMLVRFDKSTIDDLYGYYVLSSTSAKQFFENRSKRAVNQASLNRADLGSFRLPLPPLGEQRKIAAVLSSVDDAIEASQAVIDQLQVVKKAMMAELLTRGLPGRHTRFKQTEIGEVPESWNIVALGSIARSIVPGRNKPSSFGGDIPWITVSDLASSRVSDSLAGLRVSRDVMAACGGKAVPAGAVLLSCVGRFGIASMAERELMTNQQLHGFVCGPAAHPLYVCFCLQHSTAQMQALAGQTTIPYLNRALCEAIRIPLPPVAEQEAIVDAIEAVEIRIRVERCALEPLVASKAALISVLLTGEVRVKPDEDAA